VEKNHSDREIMLQKQLAEEALWGTDTAFLYGLSEPVLLVDGFSYQTAFVQLELSGQIIIQIEIW